MKNIIWIVFILFGCTPKYFSPTKLVGHYSTKELSRWVILGENGKHEIIYEEYGMSFRGSWSVKDDKLLVNNKHYSHPFEINVNIQKKPKSENVDTRKMILSLNDSLLYDKPSNIRYETNISTQWDGYFFDKTKTIELPDSLNEICFLYGNKKCYDIEKDSMDYYIELSLDKSYVPFYYEKDTLEVKSHNKIIWNGLVLKRVK